MHLVVNEWLLEYLIPGTEFGKKAQVNTFFNLFFKSSSKIVIGRATPFISKYYRYLGQYGYDFVFKKNYKKLYELLFLNSTRTIIVEKEETKHIQEEKLSGIHNDDWYLLDLAFTVPDSTIISTDSRLIDAVSLKNIAKIMHLHAYISGNYQ